MLPLNSRASLKLFLLTALALSACVRNPTTGKKEFHMISEKAEMNLGQESKNEIVKQYGLYQNPAVQAYINEVGNRVAGAVERKVHYEFVILDTPLVNAFAVPGVVFLTRGILELIDDEAELASVIGHELGHITGFHAVKLIQKQYGYGFLATFAAIAGTIYAPAMQDSQSYAAYYDTLYRGIGLVTAGFLSGYGRGFELEADQSGLRYAILAGYDPDAMISFFKRMDSLDKDEDSGISLFLRSHPPTKDRIAQVKKSLDLAQNFPRIPKKGVPYENIKKMAHVLQSTAALSDNFERYQEIVRSIPKLEGNQQGSIKGGHYEHSALRVSLEVPQGWKFQRSYGKALVSFVKADGKAQGELQYRRFGAEPLLVSQSTTQIAGVTKSTALIMSEDWAASVEPVLKLQKRTGRVATYPAGNAYVGTYYGIDRLGRAAFIKIYFIVRGKVWDRQDGFVLFCGAPDENYLDYLVDFERLAESLRWRNP